MQGTHSIRMSPSPSQTVLRRSCSSTRSLLLGRRPWHVSRRRTSCSKGRRSTALWARSATSPTWSRRTWWVIRPASPSWRPRLARDAGLGDEELQELRRGALVHDIGRVAVPARIWQQPGALFADDWERVRLHPYHTERILSRSPFLASLAPIAAFHHERLDGSGYHRGSMAAALSTPARVLAAADTYHTMTEPRPHRGAQRPQQAAGRLGGEVRAGRLDPDAVGAVLAAAGQHVPRISRPGGSDRPGKRGRRPDSPWPADQAGRPNPRDLGQDRRPSHPERVSEDGSLHPGRGRRCLQCSTGSRHGENSRWGSAAIEPRVGSILNERCDQVIDHGEPDPYLR